MGIRRTTRFGISTGWIVSTLKTGLAASAESIAAGVTVQPKKPTAMVKRLITVRNDGGPDDGILSRRRTGFNIWAEDSTTAEQLAHLAIAILRSAPPTGPVALPAANVESMRDFSAPFEIDEDPDEVAALNGAVLSHWYFTGTVLVRAADF